MGTQSTSKQWMQYLKPLVAGAVALMACATGYLQYLQKQDSTRLDSRVTALETRADAQDKRSDKFGDEIDNFKVLLSDIRSDVSFIRGKMESHK